ERDLAACERQPAGDRIRAGALVDLRPERLRECERVATFREPFLDRPGATRVDAEHERTALGPPHTAILRRELDARDLARGVRAERRRARRGGPAEAPSERRADRLEALEAVTGEERAGGCAPSAFACARGRGDREPGLVHAEPRRGQPWQRKLERAEAALRLH